MRGACALGALVALVSGCATRPPPLPPPPPVEAPQALAHVSPFDLDNCFPAPLELPRPANPDALRGLLTAALPEVVECLVDPAHRGAAPTTRLALGARVNAEGAEHEARGENLTPRGQACVEQALRLRASIDPLPGGEASAELALEHQVGRDPGVVLGVNDASDAVAQVRLALPRFCDCLEGFRTRAPRSFQGQLELASGGGPPLRVTFPPSDDDPVTAAVQACLAERVGALEFSALHRPLTTALPVVLLHSGVSEPLGPDAPPELAGMQREALRLRRTADVALARGARVNAAAAFDAAVRAQKKLARPAAKKELDARCAELLAADELWIAALEAPALLDQSASALEEARNIRSRDAAACSARRM